MSSNMHDVVRRLAPGSVVSWQSGRFTYVAYLTRDGLFYTTATEHNTYVPQVLTPGELANLLDAEGAALYLAIKWEVQDQP